MNSVFHPTPVAETPSEKWGQAFGKFLGLITYWVSRIRQARTFHPVGLDFRGTVVSAFVPGSLPELGTRDSAESGVFMRDLARRLSGPAMLRFSTALWKDENERLDVLGCAIRFRAGETFDPLPHGGDQDLLFATVRTPLLTLVAPFFTDPHDFRTNLFYAVSPFSVDSERGEARSQSPVLFRFRFIHGRMAFTSNPGTRREKLRRSVREGEGAIELSISFIHGSEKWHPCVRIEIQAELEKGRDIDDAALRFSPFQAGKGIHPRGFVHYLRIGAYSQSQAGRPSRGN